MISDQMRDYIVVCRKQGISDAQIRQALLGAGWLLSAVNEALPEPTQSTQPPIIPIRPIYPPIRSRRKLGRIFVLTFGLVLLSGIGTVVFAELGYLPAVSRIYRATPLPLLWKSSTSDATLNIGNAMTHSATENNVQLNATYSLTVHDENNQGSAYIRDIPLLGKTLAALLPDKMYANQPLIATQEIVKASQTPLLLSVPSSVTTPLTIKATYSVRSDSDKNSQMSLSLDLNSFLKAFPELSPILDSQQTNVTIDAKAFPSQNHYYIKSSALPAQQEKDSEKWFAYNLPKNTEITPSKVDSSLLIDTSKGNDLQQLHELLKSVSKDEGIVRRNGSAVSHYKIVIDKKTLASLKESSSIRNSEIVFSQFDYEDAVISADFYIEPRSHRIKEMQLEMKIDAPNGSNRVTLTLNHAFAYGGTTKVEAPQSVDVHKENFDTYINGVRKLTSAELASTGMFTRDGWDFMLSSTSTTEIGKANTTRKTDIAQINKEIKEYIKSNNEKGHTNTPPTTNNVAIRLDTPDSVLTSIPSMEYYLPLADPEPDRFYYSYKSDGTNYELACVILDESTREPVRLFGFRNGISFDEPL